MQRLDLTYQVLYSELAQRSLDAAFSSDFDVDGRFIKMDSRGRKYWYFDTAKPEGGKARRYVGPVDDEAITQRVEAFKDLKADARARRKIISTLVREAYLPRPEAKVGDVIAALAEAGFFRLRGVLVGTVAFQVYCGLLGYRFLGTSLQTQDVDLAQFHSTSVAVKDQMPAIIEVLRQVDPTFREIPDRSDGRHTTQYRDRSGYRVEFLTPNQGSDTDGDRPMNMPALGGTSAQPLRFLDYLIHEPVRAVLLHGSGIPVMVPAPERFAIHKLIVSTRRLQDDNGLAKSLKDRLQARTLMWALRATGQTNALADVYMEAMDRGPSWRESLVTAIDSYEESVATAIRTMLSTGIRRLKADPADYVVGARYPPQSWEL